MVLETGDAVEDAEEAVLLEEPVLGGARGLDELDSGGSSEVLVDIVEVCTDVWVVLLGGLGL